MLLSPGTKLCQNVMVVKPIEYMLMIKLKNINLIYLKHKGKLNNLSLYSIEYRCQTKSCPPLSIRAIFIVFSLLTGFEGFASRCRLAKKDGNICAR